MLTDPVLQFLLAGLQHAQLSTVAANALKKICEQCSAQMTEHFSGLLHIVQAVDSFNVSHDASIGLLRGESIMRGSQQMQVASASNLALVTCFWCEGYH